MLGDHGWCHSQAFNLCFLLLDRSWASEEAAVCFWHHRSGHLWLLGYLFSCLFLMAVWMWPCVRSPVFAPVLHAPVPLPVASSFQPLVQVSSHCGETCAVTDNGVQQGGVA